MYVTGYPMRRFTSSLPPSKSQQPKVAPEDTLPSGRRHKRTSVLYSSSTRAAVYSAKMEGLPSAAKEVAVAAALAQKVPAALLSNPRLSPSPSIEHVNAMCMRGCIQLLAWHTSLAAPPQATAAAKDAEGSAALPRVAFSAKEVLSDFLSCIVREARAAGLLQQQQREQRQQQQQWWQQEQQQQQVEEQDAAGVEAAQGLQELPCQQGQDASQKEDPYCPISDLHIALHAAVGIQPCKPNSCRAAFNSSKSSTGAMHKKVSSFGCVEDEDGRAEAKEGEGTPFRLWVEPQCLTETIATTLQVVLPTTTSLWDAFTTKRRDIKAADDGESAGGPHGHGGARARAEVLQTDVAGGAVRVVLLQRDEVVIDEHVVLERGGVWAGENVVLGSDGQGRAKEGCQEAQRVGDVDGGQDTEAGKQGKRVAAMLLKDSVIQVRLNVPALRLPSFSVMSDMVPATTVDQVSTAQVTKTVHTEVSAAKVPAGGPPLWPCPLELFILSVPHTPAHLYGRGALSANVLSSLRGHSSSVSMPAVVTYALDQQQGSEPQVHLQQHEVLDSKQQQDLRQQHDTILGTAQLLLTSAASCPEQLPAAYLPYFASPPAAHLAKPAAHPHSSPQAQEISHLMDRATSMLAEVKHQERAPHSSATGSGGEAQSAAAVQSCEGAELIALRMAAWDHHVQPFISDLALLFSSHTDVALVLAARQEGASTTPMQLKQIGLWAQLLSSLLTFCTNQGLSAWAGMLLHLAHQTSANSVLAADLLVPVLRGLREPTTPAFKAANNNTSKPAAAPCNEPPIAASSCPHPLQSPPTLPIAKAWSGCLQPSRRIPLASKVSPRARSGSQRRLLSPPLPSTFLRTRLTSQHHVPSPPLPPLRRSIGRQSLNTSPPLSPSRSTDCMAVTSSRASRAAHTANLLAQRAARAVNAARGQAIIFSAAGNPYRAASGLTPMRQRWQAAVAYLRKPALIVAIETCIMGLLQLKQQWQEVTWSQELAMSMVMAAVQASTQSALQGVQSVMAWAWMHQWARSAAIMGLVQVGLGWRCSMCVAAAIACVMVCLAQQKRVHLGEAAQAGRVTEVPGAAAMEVGGVEPGAAAGEVRGVEPAAAAVEAGAGLAELRAQGASEGSGTAPGSAPAAAAERGKEAGAGMGKSASVGGARAGGLTVRVEDNADVVAAMVAKQAVDAVVARAVVEEDAARLATATGAAPAACAECARTHKQMQAPTAAEESEEASAPQAFAQEHKRAPATPPSTGTTAAPLCLAHSVFISHSLDPVCVRMPNGEMRCRLSGLGERAVLVPYLELAQDDREVAVSCSVLAGGEHEVTLPATPMGTGGSGPQPLRLVLQHAPQSEEATASSKALSDGIGGCCSRTTGSDKGGCYNTGTGSNASYSNNNNDDDDDDDNSRQSNPGEGEVTRGIESSSVPLVAVHPTEAAASPAHGPPAHIAAAKGTPPSLATFGRVATNTFCPLFQFSSAPELGTEKQQTPPSPHTCHSDFTAHALPLKLPDCTAFSSYHASIQSPDSPSTPTALHASKKSATECHRVREPEVAEEQSAAPSAPPVAPAAADAASSSGESSLHEYKSTYSWRTRSKGDLPASPGGHSSPQDKLSRFSSNAPQQPQQHKEQTEQQTQDTHQVLSQEEQQQQQAWLQQQLDWAEEPSNLQKLPELQQSILNSQVSPSHSPGPSLADVSRLCSSHEPFFYIASPSSNIMGPSLSAVSPAPSIDALISTDEPFFTQEDMTAHGADQQQLNLLPPNSPLHPLPDLHFSTDYNLGCGSAAAEDQTSLLPPNSPLHTPDLRFQQPFPSPPPSPKLFSRDMLQMEGTPLLQAPPLSHVDQGASFHVPSPPSPKCAPPASSAFTPEQSFSSPFPSPAHQSSSTPYPPSSAKGVGDHPTLEYFPMSPPTPSPSQLTQSIPPVTSSPHHSPPPVPWLGIPKQPASNPYQSALCASSAPLNLHWVPPSPVHVPAALSSYSPPLSPRSRPLSAPPFQRVPKNGDGGEEDVCGFANVPHLSPPSLDTPVRPASAQIMPPPMQSKQRSPHEALTRPPHLVAMSAPFHLHH